MKSTPIFCLILLGVWLPAHADWTIVQDVETINPTMGMTNRITMKFAGKKFRVDSGPHQSTISDDDSGEQIILMHLQKQFIVRSASQRKEGMEIVKRMTQVPGESSGKPPELRATGRKVRIGDYDTEEFAWESSKGKGSYWVASNYPNYAAILSSMESAFVDARSLIKGAYPDPTVLRGMPVRTETEQLIEVPSGLTPAQAKQAGIRPGQTTRIVTTLISAKEGKLDESEFATPAGYTPVGGTPSVGASSANGLSDVLKAMQKKGLSEADRKNFEQIIKAAESQQKSKGVPNPK